MEILMTDDGTWMGCPACGSVAGDPCLDNKGNRTIYIHEGRLRQQEFRQALENAWEAGFAQGLIDLYAEPNTFSEWFDKHYGDIIGKGTESPASEKVSVKEEISPPIVKRVRNIRKRRSS